MLKQIKNKPRWGAHMRIVRLAAVLAAGFLVANCATVTRGTTNQVQVQSEPGGAEARTSLGHSCTTPCTLQFDRKAEFDIVYTKPGFKSQTIAVRTKIAGEGALGFAGNVIIGGVVGMGVDAVTGATLEHAPNPAKAFLEAEPSLPVGRKKNTRRKPPPVVQAPRPAPAQQAPPAEEPPPAT